MSILNKNYNIKVSTGNVEDSTIYYTTDNTEPTSESGTLYDKELGVDINSNTVLKFKAYAPDREDSDVFTYTYKEPNISLEEVGSVDYMWDGVYNYTGSEPYTYNGFQDDEDFIFKIKYVNGYYFLLGFNNKDSYSGNTVGIASVSTNRGRAVILYSTDLKNWKNLNMKGNYHATDIVYFNNKYVATVKFYQSTNQNDEGTGEETTVISYNNYYSTSITVNNSNTTGGWKILTWATLESIPEELDINESSLGIPIYTHTNYTSSYYTNCLSIPMEIIDNRLFFIVNPSQSNTSTTPSYVYIISTKNLKSFIINYSEICQLSSTSYKVHGLEHAQLLYHDNKVFAIMTGNDDYESNANYLNFGPCLFYSEDTYNWYKLIKLERFSNNAAVHKAVMDFSNGTLFLAEGDSSSIYDNTLKVSFNPFESKETSILDYDYILGAKDGFLVGVNNSSSTINIINTNLENLIGLRIFNYYYSSNTSEATSHSLTTESTHPLFKDKDGNICVIARYKQTSTSTPDVPISADYEADEYYNKFKIYKLNIDLNN